MHKLLYNSAFVTLKIFSFCEDCKISLLVIFEGMGFFYCCVVFNYYIVRCLYNLEILAKRQFFLVLRNLLKSKL